MKDWFGFLNHEDHEEHEDFLKYYLRALRVLRGKNPGVLRGLKKSYSIFSSLIFVNNVL